MTRLPEHPLPAKPRWLEPCNGCGLCCQLQVCQAGRLAFKTKTAPCPGLVFTKERTFCILVQTEIEHKLPPVIQEMLVIGGGCTMPDDDTPKVHIDRWIPA